MTTGTTAVQVRVTGRVQGVAFRAWARDEARARGLAGWVRNAADGSVALLLAGPPAAVEAMLAALHEGPRHARVAAVAAEPADPATAPADFEVRR